MGQALPPASVCFQAIPCCILKNMNVRRVQVLVLVAAAAAIFFAVRSKTSPAASTLRPPEKRRPMPDFALPAIGSGGQWQLSAHRGQVVLVNFWATWCPPCRQETPGLVAIHKRYAARGFSVVGISMDDNPLQAVPGFAERYKMPYPLLAPTPGFALADKIESLPTTFLVDRKGRVARSYVGAVSENLIEDDIEALLAES